MIKVCALSPQRSTLGACAGVFEPPVPQSIPGERDKSAWRTSLFIVRYRSRQVVSYLVSWG